jgi:hypothetical protein
MNASWLIDDQGEKWPGRSHRIAQWKSTLDPIGYAIAELGFIGVQALSDRAVEVRFNPHRTGPTAVAAVFYLIFDLLPQRVVLSYGHEHLQTEIYDRVTALQRVEELISMGLPIAGPHVTARRRSIDRPRRLHRRRIASLMQAWSEHTAEWNAELQAKLQQAMLLDSAVVVRNSRGSERLVIDYWGANRALLGRRWTQIAPGRDVEDQPFPNLGAWVAAGYRQALADRLPRLDDIDIVLPQPDGGVVTRLYERLLLPWRGPDGDDYAMTVNFPRRTRVYSSAGVTETGAVEPRESRLLQ